MTPILIILFLGTCFWAACCKAHMESCGDIGRADVWGYAWFAATLAAGMLFGWFFPELIFYLWSLL